MGEKKLVYFRILSCIVKSYCDPQNMQTSHCEKSERSERKRKSACVSKRVFERESVRDLKEKE